MKAQHVPLINSRYWVGIALASVFGTNLGDYYAHESGLGLIGGLPILAAAFFLVFVIERFDRAVHDVYYWICILIMRTGATNVADSSYSLVRAMPQNDITLMAVVVLGLVFFWGSLIGLFAWGAVKIAKPGLEGVKKAVPETNGFYWSAMLSAGIFGTMLGDLSSFALGGGLASVALGGLLVVALAAGRFLSGISATYYWLIVAIARTAGTAAGDWLAEDKTLGLGLATSTLITGVAFFSVIGLWRMGGAAKTSYTPA